MTDAEAVAAVLAAPDEELGDVVAVVLAAADADARLMALKEASERQRGISPPAALKLADALVCGARMSDRPSLLALGLMAKGDALRLVDNHADAEAHLDEAAALFRSLGDDVGWARTRIGWVAARRHAAASVAEIRADVAAVESAYAVLAAAGEWRRAATLDLNRGAVLTDVGCYADAAGCYDRALAVVARLPAGDDARNLAAQTLANQAVNLSCLGDFAASLERHAAARAVFAELGRAAAVVVQDLNLADVYIATGDLARALKLLLDAEAGALGIDDLSSAAVAALDAARCYLHLACPQAALRQAEQALGWFEAREMPLEAALAQLYAGVAHGALGHRSRAAGRLRLAAGAFDRLGNAPFAGMAALQQAGVLLAAGDAAAAVAEAERARALLSGAGRRVHAARAGIVLAHAMLDIGRTDAAVPLAESALRVASDAAVPQLAADGHHVRARVARAARQPRTALAACEAAVETLERLQARLPFGLRTHFLARQLGPYREAIDLCLEVGLAERALAYLERSKSRALVDFVADAVQVEPPDRAGAAGDIRAAGDARSELAALSREHQWCATRLHAGTTDRDDGSTRPDDPSPLGDRSDGDAAALIARIAALEHRIDTLHRRLELAHGAGELPVVRRPDVAALRSRLDGGTGLVAYYFRAGGGTAFVVTRERVEAVPLALGAVEVGEAARSLGDLWAMTAELVAAGRSGAVGALDRSARDVLRALYGGLVEPVADRLAGARRVVVVPHGAAHGLPFHALFDGRRFWLEDVECVVSPSAELWRIGTERPPTSGTGALVLGCSDGGRLPGVLDEARAVAELLPGPGDCRLEDAATTAALRSASTRRAVIHVAAHGEARFDSPQFAHLRLHDGGFTTRDAFNLRLDGALVTLSACESGCSVVAGGDELIGLSRGFLYAGASTVIQSLWRVEDDRTARLMLGLCRGLREGLGAGEALRRAQLEAGAGSGLPVFYWGAFQALGTGRPVGAGTGGAPFGNQNP